MMRSELGNKTNHPPSMAPKKQPPLNVDTTAPVKLGFGLLKWVLKLSNVRTDAMIPLSNYEANVVSTISEPKLKTRHTCHICQIGRVTIAVAEVNKLLRPTGTKRIHAQTRMNLQEDRVNRSFHTHTILVNKHAPIEQNAAVKTLYTRPIATERCINSGQKKMHLQKTDGDSSHIQCSSKHIFIYSTAVVCRNSPTPHAGKLRRQSMDGRN